MAKLTIQALKDRIAADTKKLAEMEAAAAAGNAMANLASGDVIEFMFGRGETRKQRAGVVLGIAETDKGKKIKVQTGEGFDAEILVITPDAIVAVAEDSTQAGAASADPLASLS
jgi:sRNA-binding protein